MIETYFGSGARRVDGGVSLSILSCKVERVEGERSKKITILISSLEFLFDWKMNEIIFLKNWM